MDLDHTDLLRRFIDAINRRDVDAWRAVTAPDFEFRSAFGTVEGAPFSGPDAAPSYFAALEDVWETFVLEVDELVDLGDGRVAHVSTVRARGVGSGVEMAPRIVGVVRIADGRIVEGETYTDEAQGRRAAGI